ncbi:hypothetical protein CU098_001117, partial [Rhizopus stolonifer]
MSAKTGSKLNTTISEDNISSGCKEYKKPVALNEGQKPIEAKTAVILLKNSRLCTKNEYTQWLLKILYQPCSRRETEGKNVLYLSRSRRKIWATDFSINQDPARSDVKKNKDQLYVITPKTSIMTMNQENRLVYIVDLSSSLATVGNTRSDILLSEVFQALRNSLEGVVQPFSMQVSPTEKVVVQPSLRLTVMADCSQFASNINIIPMLAEHPTMRVFMQNEVISVSNIRAIIRKLKAEFLAFQEDTTQFRKFMRRNRQKMGYNLDVGNEVTPPTDVGVINTPKSFTKSKIHKESLENEQKTPTNTSFYSSNSKKEVWGIGKSGANLSRILHAGHFALKLLPRQGRAQLILITDGAMKSNVHDNTFVRQFAEEDITCHVIQIGFASSFIPGRNFGFVPDTEILQFLARATNGTFMYSKECLTNPDSNTFVFDQSNEESQNTTNPEKYPIVQFIDINKAKHIQTPNIFHRQFLFRETVLTRYHHSELRLQAEKDSQSQLNRREISGNSMRDANNSISSMRYNFPWDPYAKAPEDEWRLLKYREYTLPAEFSHVIAARAREGFTLQSVFFDDGTGFRHVESGLHDLEVSDLATLRKERIQILMTMRWQPNVTIEFRIRATWLPTIIGNAPSSYKNEDILMSSGIFSRAKAPRAEIFVRTDASFAHMLQNWDVFRRRAQMMGVVTGSIHVGDTHTAPIYSKIERLKTYLTDIYEGDEVLKTVIGFPNKFWVGLGSNNDSNASSLLSTSFHSESKNPNTMLSRIVVAQRRSTFVDAFKNFWERFNSSEARARTRCWYDPGCVDLLVGDVSPYMTPKLTSAYNQEFVSNIEQDILLMLNNVRQVIKEWADFEAEDGTFVKLMHKLSSSPLANADEQVKDYFSASLAYPPAFCELRVRHEYGRLITLRLLFFNVEVATRRRTVEYMRYLIETSEKTKMPCNMVCRRPFSRLLMRDPKHFADPSTTTESDGTAEKILGNLTKNQSRAKAWYLPVAMWLTSEYIVRDYLKHMTWCWQTDNSQDAYHRENKMMPVHDLAFQFLCQARLDQGYQLVSPRPDSTQFYQEITLPGRNGKEASVCAIQYFVWKDPASGNITTEWWMEPSGNFDFDQYELVKRWTFEPDKKTISQLVTFDQIHDVGRSKKIGDFKSKRRGTHAAISMEDNTLVMTLPKLFDIASVLKSNKFVVASFQSPQYKMVLSLPNQQKQPQYQQIKLKSLASHFDESNLEGNDQSGCATPVLKGKNAPQAKTQRYLRRHTHNALPVGTTTETNSPQKLFSFKPDSLLNQNKETIAKLNAMLQSYALLHYFVERSLDYVSSGEILISHHDIGTSFWQDLRKALQSVIKEGRASSVGSIADLRKTRCFVKTFDPRSFVVILLPNLESISNGLLKLQEDEKANSKSTLENCHFLDVYMFECIRQKPMRPTKNELLFASPLEEANRSRIEKVVDDADKITIRPVKYLIHKSDGLGVMLRPELYEGEYSSCQPQAQLTDRVLRVAQDIVKHYSISFLKSFYTCLMRGFVVDDDGLSKALEVCNESLMELDMTEFVNTMTMQRHTSVHSEIQEVEIQAKFNAILNQYFEPVRTKNGSISNLYYYKPPFKRYDNSSQQENMTMDEKISHVVDLVVHSQSPLLIKLFVVYKSSSIGGQEQQEITVPIISLPTSYTGKTTDGTSFNFENQENTISDMFPLADGSTKAYLQLICLNLPRSDTNDYTMSENLFSINNDNILIQLMQSQPECFSSLTQDQKLALAETDSRLNWLLKEETIHGLLKTPVITLYTLKYVEYQLSMVNPYAEYQTSFKIPFHFVKNYAQSRDVFMLELEKDCCRKSNRKYQLRRLDDYFYVCQDSIFNMGEESSYSNSASPVFTDVSPIVNEAEHFETHLSAGEDEFCDGLGISLSQGGRAEEEECMSDREGPSIPLEKRPLYWLILIPQERYIQIYFYSKMQILGPGLEVLNPIREKIKSVQEKTNRLTLLNYLQDTRMCSNIIIGCNRSTQHNQKGKDTFNKDEPLNTIKFLPGEFSCPLIYTKRFPLHWRLQPNVALKFLTTDVLRLFTVMNRSNMFVVERDGSIVYCKIYEELLDEETEGSPNTVYGSPAQTISGKPTEDDAQTLVGFNSTTDSTSKHDIIKNSSTSPRSRGMSSNRVPSNDKRQLVLEVFGIDLPPWVEKEFVNMIENRLISQITLNEVQHFFARNTTSKPTIADVEFIIPTSKTPTRREVLRIPRLVNSPYILMQYFGQSLTADNIRYLTGPYVQQVVKSYYDHIFFSEKSFAIQESSAHRPKRHGEMIKEIPPGAYCFYYNCTKRIPSSSTPLELSAGQGIAGICLTLLDETGTPVTSLKDNSKSGANFDPEVIYDCLEEDFREATTGATFYHIWVDIWVTGSADGDALMQHVYECYKQSLCDYFIEKTVTIDLGVALSLDGALQKAVSNKKEGRLGTIVRKKFIESVLFILKKSSELKSPTVCCMDRAIQTTLWCMDDLVRFLDIELRKIHPSLAPTVAWTSIGNDVWGDDTDKPSPNSKWELYRGFQYRQHQKLQHNIRLVAISGLDEFVEKLGSVSTSFGTDRRPSATSDTDSLKARSRRSSGESAMTEGGNNRRGKSDLQDQSRASSALSNSGLIARHRPNVNPGKHCFLIMTLDVHRLSIYTYNWSESISEELFDGIFRVANRQEARNDIMTNILHQKMGLFHHTTPIKTVIETLETTGSASPTKFLSTTLFSTGSAHPASTPHIHLTSPKSTKKTTKQHDTSIKSDTTSNPRTPNPMRRNANMMMGSSPSPISASMLDFKDMIAFPTVAPSHEELDTKPGDNHSSISRQTEQEKHIDRILQNSLIRNAELDCALMNSITDSVADTVRSKDMDILRRHGQPFLETFLRRAKIQSAHRKALKVYLKWRKRYGDPQVDVAKNTERLSRPEVSTIMRSSRILHFCRTPIIFCDPERDWSSLPEDSNGRALIV